MLFFVEGLSTSSPALPYIGEKQDRTMVHQPYLKRHGAHLNGEYILSMWKKVACISNIKVN